MYPLDNAELLPNTLKDLDPVLDTFQFFCLKQIKHPGVSSRQKNNEILKQLITRARMHDARFHMLVTVMGLKYHFHDRACTNCKNVSKKNKIVQAKIAEFFHPINQKKCE